MVRVLEAEINAGRVIQGRVCSSAIRFHVRGDIGVWRSLSRWLLDRTEEKEEESQKATVKVLQDGVARNESESLKGPLFSLSIRDTFPRCLNPNNLRTRMRHSFWDGRKKFDR